MYGAIATWLPELVPADRASVTLLAGVDALEVLGLHGQEGIIPLGKRLPLGSSGPGAAVTTGVTQCWTVTDHPDRFESPAMAESGLHGFINAPLVVQDNAVGALNVARADHGYDDRDAYLLQEIANLVSVNLERFQSLAHARQQLTKATKNQQRLELLSELGRRLSSTSNDADAFAAVAELTVGVLPVDRLSLAFPDPSDQTFRIVALQQGGISPEGLRAGDTIPLYPSGVGDVYRTGLTVYVPDMASSDFKEHRHLAASGLKSGLSVPVHAQGEVVAVFNSAAAALDAYEVEDRTAAEAIATLLGETLERIRSRDALAVRERELAGIVDDSPLLMMTIDSDGAIVQLSEFGASQLGYEAATLRGKPLTTLYPPDQQHDLQLRLADLARQPPDTVTVWESQMINARDARVRVRHSGRRLALDSSASTILVCEDVTELVELADRLAHEATHDPLTGLVNRREFDRRLKSLIDSPSEDAPGSVLYLDIDHFKIVNDTSGHHAGDALLVELAATLGALLPSQDIFARLGGDEFAVLLPNCSLANAVRVAERLRSAANDITFIWNNRSFGTSLSIGVAAIDRKRPETDDVMGRADAACYDAKNEGRNKVSVASGQQMTGRSTRADGEWGSRLRDALRDGNLCLVSQRIAAVEDLDERNRLELLVRLDNGAGELVPAAMFIPAAERLGIVTEIDRWVVTKVAELLSADAERWPELDFVAVNLSARSIESDDFLDHLVEALATPGLDPTKLLFEITETAALSQFSKAVRFIETVSAVGCRFALDDFGAGFSTFHYLKRLPVDVLKIDGSLVRDLTTDPIDRSIVRSIVDVAESLGMKTVAEFVDDQSTIDWLEKLGVDYAQGYGIGRPAPIEPAG